jgi:hypothetical protein
VSDIEQEKQIHESLERIAERAAKKAVSETLVMFGIDISSPIQAQTQFVRLRQLSSERTIDNLEFLDRLHTASDRVSDTGWKTFIRVIVTAGLGLLAIMTRDYWLGHFWHS